MHWAVQKGDHAPGAWNPEASFLMKHLWDHPEEVSFPGTLLLPRPDTTGKIHFTLHHPFAIRINKDERNNGILGLGKSEN